MFSHKYKMDTNLISTFVGQRLGAGLLTANLQNTVYATSAYVYFFPQCVGNDGAAASANNLGTPCRLLPLSPLAMFKRLQNLVFSA